MCKGAKILVVDDDQDLVLGLSIRLQANHYQVYSAFGVPDAIETAQREKPDLVILDITFPIGNGILLIPRLRMIESLEDVPVIVMTGKSLPFLRDEAITMGAQAYLQKPMDNDELLTTVRSLLHRTGQAPRPQPQQSSAPG
jgi:DNA-binding response OmpR family regulator